MSSQHQTTRLSERIHTLTPEKRALLAKRLGQGDGEFNTFPLSFAQERLWLIDQLEPGNPSYNLSTNLRLEGRLEVDTLRRTLDEVIRRHESLRTSFPVIGGSPMQAIAPARPFHLPVVELGHLPAADRNREVRRLMQAEARQPFDLARGPILRACLLRLNEEEHVLLFTMHHIVGDAWSTQVLIREVTALYEAYSKGLESPLADLPLQYADFAVWQRRRLRGEVLEAQLAYWRSQLEGAPPELYLPSDHPRPAIKSYKGGRERFLLSTDLSMGLKDLGRQEGATLFMVLMAALKLLLMRYSGAEDVCVGTVIANRTRKEVEGLIGFFVNTLVMRTDLGGNPSFRELIGREKEVALGAYGHQEAPFEKLVEEINPERGLNRSPLFQVMMVLQNASREELEIRGLRVSAIGEETDAAKFDLTLTLSETGEGITGCLEYSKDLFEADTIRRMAAHYGKALEEVVRDAEQPIKEVALMSPAERRQVVEEWNETERVYRETRLVHEMIQSQASRRPDGLALKCEDYQISFRELNRRANQLARYLRELGVGPEVLVGLCLERSIEMVVGLLAVLKAGGAYVPIDTTYPDHRLSMMIDDAKIRLLLTQEHLAERCSGRSVNLICLDRDWKTISTRSPENVHVRLRPDNAAYVIYTSGSTGRPKGVVVTHRSVLNLFNAVDERLHFSESDVWTFFHSYSFDFSVWEIWGALIYGGALVVVPHLVARMPEEFYDLVRQNGVTILSQTPSAFRHFIKVHQEAGAGGDLSLRAVIFGGEALELNGLHGWMERLGDESPRLINMYGITETTVHTTYRRVTSKDLKDSSGSVIGRPLANMRMYVLDECMQPVPAGVVGELYVAGDGMTRGYLGREDLTAEKFIPAPHSYNLGERIYRTGDLARYMSDGDLEYLGRKDHQIKIRGYRIELGEIESVISQHEAISEAVMIAGGEPGEEKRLIAYLVSAGDGRLVIGELKTYLRQRLPDYMAPSAFVMLDKLPLTPNGKVDRKALPRPKQERDEGDAAYLAPRTPVEEILLGIYAEVLKLNRVGLRDNFFEIGGHSLLATQVVSRVRDVFGVEVGIRSIFEAAAVEDFARKIEEAMSQGRMEKAPPLLRVSREEKLPLSFAQQRLWFIDQLVPNNPLYNIPVAVKLKGELNLWTLEKVINEIVRRHEALRTRIEMEEGEPAQVIDPWEPRSLEVEDLTALDADRREEEARRIARKDAVTGFDLSRGPLMRVKVFKLGEEHHMMLIAMHHIVSDAWSMGILIKEMGALYGAYGAGEASPLEELPIQYADYAKWQRERLVGEVLKDEVGYWMEQLKDASTLELPTDHPRPAAPSYRGGQERIELSWPLSEALRSLSQRVGATLFMVLMAAFKLLLMRYSGLEDVVVGTVIANRTRKEVEGLIGFFVNTLALRTDLGGNPTFKELITREREVALEAYGHQQVPFEKLVEEINPDRDLSRSPLFQVMMVLQNTAREEVGIKGLEVERIDPEIGSAKFDLMLTLTEGREGIAGSLEYASDLYDAETIGRMARHYRRIVDGAIKNEERRIREIELLSPDEKMQLIVEFNRTERNYERELCIQDLIEAQVERGGHQTAVVCEEETITYQELNARANQVARYLIRQGVNIEDRVGICIERSIEMVIGMLGIIKAGAAYAPLDPAYPAERIAFMLEDAQVKVLLTDTQSAASLPASDARIITLQVKKQAIAAESKKNLPVRAAANNLAYVIYTSGSTGRPKGVLVPHRQALNFFFAMDACLEPVPGSVWLAVTSISFDISVLELFWTLARGYKVVVQKDRRNTGLADGLQDQDGSVSEQMIRHQVSHLQCTPSMAKMLIVEEDWPRASRSLYKLMVGGEALSTELVENLKQRVAAEIWNLYGPTETTVWSTAHRLRGEEERIPIGRPLANTQIYLLDQAQQSVPIGVSGELYIGGEGVVRGYLKQPGLTAERFLPDEFGGEPGRRLYRTGDLACYLADREIEFIGRVDHQVKVRGYRIELGEIERVLEQREGIQEAVVIAREENSGDKRLAAYVVAEKGRELEIKGLRKYLREKLPEYMAPSAIIVLEKMPLTPNGKLDRKALPRPGQEREGDRTGFVAPRTPVEEIVAGLFENVLKVDQVGVNDNFFEIGGHSLLATRVISRVRTTFGVEIGVRSIFERATVEDLARRIEEAIGRGEREETPPLLRISRGERLPLSFAQQRLWFLDQLAPNNAFYNLPGAVRLEGTLDLQVLERVISEIIRRHEALRTRIEVEEGQPAQVIDEWEHRSLAVEDLTCLTLEEREEKVRRIAGEEAGTGFDLRRGPMLRVKVLKLGEQEHVVLFTMHHIVSDGWSMEILNKEVGALYKAYSAGELSPLGELPIQYVDFAVWQRTWLQGEVLERELAYWRKQLVGVQDLDLPTDHLRPSAPSYRGARRRFVVERELVGKLKGLSQREGVTLFMTLLAGFDVLMSCYSGQEDVTIGTDIANRNRAEIEGLIGFFVNQLVLRVEVKAAESISQFLKRVRDVCLGAYAHQDVPFEKLVEELQPGRDLGRSPLFQAKLILQNAPGGGLELEGVKLSGLEGEAQTAKFDLTMAITDVGSDLIGVIEYSRDLFEERTIERLMSHYTNVLREIAEDSNRPIRALRLLGDQEREQIIVEWNKTDKPYPRDRSIQELFREQAERAPEQIALIYEGGRVSYRELDRRANQLARYLQKLGVGPEVVVGLFFERSLEVVVAVMGVLKSGGAYLPLDPESPLERLSYMLEDAGVGVVLTEQILEGRLPAHWGQTVCLDLEWEKISRESDTKPESEGAPENLAYVIYTSGSTGEPKGVAIDQHSLVARTMALIEAYGLTSTDRLLQFVSPSFDAFAEEVFTTLNCGASLVIDRRAVNYTAHELLDIVERLDIAILHIPPAYWHHIVDELSLSQRHVTSQLRLFITGGESPSADKLKSWAALSDHQSRFVNAYGPTEATITSTAFGIQLCSSRIHHQTRVPIGQPIANTQIYILDRNQQVLPIGAKGEIYIGGAGVARGYLGRPELSAEKFLPNPFNDEAGTRLYLTGDVGRYLEDGSIEFLGRVDEQVKVRGFRIELGEIEAALNGHRSVRQSAVVATEDGRGGRRLIAYVVGAEGVTQAELKKHVRERVPEYMVPEAILPLEEIPITANGKIDRKRLLSVTSLKEPGRQPEQELAGARTAVEEILLGIFEEVLKTDRISRLDNFFELGGHSLLATQVVSRIKNVFGADVGVRGLFEEATIESLARRVERVINAGEWDDAPPLVKASREEKLPLSFAQQRLWFIDQLEPGNSLYNNPDAVRLKGGLNLQALEAVINEIVRRHEVLRTRIELDGGAPVQVIDEWKLQRLEVEDLTSLTREEQEEEVRTRAGVEASTGFDLSRGPLLRVKVVKLEEEEHVVFFTMHHIVSDGWSMGVLMREVCELYEAMSENKASPLPELGIQYADYACWQRQYLQGEPLDAQLGYWKRQLSGNLPTLNLAIDRAQPVVLGRRAAREYVTLSPGLTEGIKALSRREGATPFMVLLAGFKVLLYRYSGQEDVIVGTAISYRNSIELEKLIGFFTNTLPLRTDLSGDPTFRKLLERVREVSLGAYAHQDIPFERIVSEIRPERSLNQMPLFRAFFVFQNAPVHTVHLSGLTLTHVTVEGGTAKMDLGLSIEEKGKEMAGTLEYNADLFDAATMREMLARFRTLLESIVEDPDRPLSNLRLLSDEESKGQRPLDFPDLQLSQRDFENILMEINSRPRAETI